MAKEHEHKWVFLQITNEYFSTGYGGTTQPVQYAYFTCHDCKKVEKRKITEELKDK